MEEVVRKMEALSTTIKAVEQEMGKDDASFLQVRAKQEKIKMFCQYIWHIGGDIQVKASEEYD